jgi:hypothetical protein
MALLETYSDANKQQIELPITKVLIRYFNSATRGKCVKQTTTTITERYNYTGMTKTAAQTCVEAMVLEYTDEATTEVMADIQGTHMGGEMWQVDVAARKKTITYVLKDWPT